MPKIARFPLAKQRRLDELLEKNSEGTITPNEKSRLERLVSESEELAIANARKLADFTKSEPNGTSAAVAVPVTVWVSPQATER
jgi:hypothetical protein